MERRPNEIAAITVHQPYSVVTFNPAEIIHIERQIFAQIVELEDFEDYSKLKTELPGDVELRKKYLQTLEWSKFKTQNAISTSPIRQQK